MIVFEKWSLTKNLTENLNDPNTDAGVTTIAQLLRKVELEKKKHNQWSKLVVTGMLFIIGDSNCRGSMEILHIKAFN